MYASPIRTAPLIRTGRYGLRSQVELADGTKTGRNHEGVDMRAAVGTPVYPTIGGVVVQTITGWTRGGSLGVSAGRAIIGRGGAGNVVVVRGDDGRDHVYGHLSRVLVTPGQRVNLDRQLAGSGISGVTQAHLHYGLWLEFAQNRWRSIDPTLLLPWEGDVLDEFEWIKDGGAHAPATNEGDTVAADGFDWKDRHLLQLVAESQGRVERAVVGQSADLDELQRTLDEIRDPLAPKPAA